MILVAVAALGFAGVRAELTRHLHPSIRYLETPFEPGIQATFTSGSITGSFISFGNSPTPTVIASNSIAGPISGLGGFSAWFSTAWAWAPSARLAAPGLAALSLAMLVIRLRCPRPVWPRLICQAGLVASLGATFALGIRFGHALLQLTLEHVNPTMSIPVMRSGPGPSRLSWIVCQTTQPHLIGVVVLASWLVLAVGGQRRSDRSWIDRGGIAVGLGWISLLVVHLFHNEPA